MEASSTNPLIENSVLGSKLLNPEYLFKQAVNFFSGNNIFSVDTLHIIYIILSILCIFFLFVIIYSTIRLFEIRAKEHKYLHHELEEYAHHQAMKEQKSQQGSSKNERWKAVLGHLFSTNSSDWKLAIIEADSMLEGLMDQLGFKGENLGEKLKLADRDTFRSLTSAWEVHLIRNKIAHEGSAFEISLHEAKRVIALYEQIFREFGYI